MPDLLLELRSEEIPARMQTKGAELLRGAVESRLKDRGLDWKTAEAFATPRRLALIVRGLPDGVPASREERRGPRVGAPEKALAGFLRATGLTRGMLDVRGEGANAAYFAIWENSAQSLQEVLAVELPQALRAMAWPKSMRWGRGNFRWIRPLRSIVCIVDDDTGSRVVELDVEGIPCGRVTCGHPYMAPDEFTVESVDKYEDRLEEAKVILRAEKRREWIRRDVDEVARVEGLELVPDPDLVEEIVGLVEWPVVLADRIEEAFSGLPDDLVRVSMRKHQKFLSLRDPTRERIAGFAGVADIEAGDGGSRIRAGYGRVLRARLKDALFFWENDQRTGLDVMRPGLSGMVFHTALGSMEARARRVAWLATQIAPAFSVKLHLAYLAGDLAKTDLCSETVREFPELQGIVGGLLAALAGDPLEVAIAIVEQYRTENNPIHFGSSLIQKTRGDEFSTKVEEFGNRTAAVLILADHADTLWGFFAAGERPTSSRDPYALRRSALIILRTLIENNRPFSLRELIDLAEQGYGDMLLVAREDASSSLQAFMLERLRVDLREGGSGYGKYRHDMVAAAGLRGAEVSPIQFKQRAETLNLLFVDRSDPDLSKQADAMLAAWRRCASILDAEGNSEEDGVPASGLYCEPAEHSLALALKQAQEIDDHRLHNPVAALAELKELYGSVGPFFEQVRVNHPDLIIRQNRLRLLAQVRAVLEKVADFGAIEG